MVEGGVVERGQVVGGQGVEVDKPREGEGTDSESVS